MTDPISDMVVRIKNAAKAGKISLVVPYSKIKDSISKILMDNGFIENYSVKDTGNIADKALEISLKYTDHKKPIILDIKTTSTPGLRIYKKVKEIKPFKSGLGIEIISTSQGMMTDIECREKNIGGLTLIKIM